MRLLLLLASLLSAPADAATPLRAVCTWTGARWEQDATLYLPGTAIAFAFANAGDGVTLDGTLGLDNAGLMRFRVHLGGAGLQVDADTAPNADPIFHLARGTVKLGPVGMLVPNAIVGVVGSESGAVRVTPFHTAGDMVWAPDAVGVVPCERLSAYRAPAPHEQDALKAAGFSADLPEKAIPSHRGAYLADSPRGRRVGRIRPQPADLPVRVAGEKDGWAHVVYADWTGVVWQGWVPARKLTDLSGGWGAKGGVLGGILSAASGGEPPPVRRCDHSVPLHARVHGLEVEIGKVAAGTPMQVEGEQGGRLSVTFPGGWLQPAGGGRFLVPDAVRACPGDRASP